MFGTTEYVGAGKQRIKAQAWNCRTWKIILEQP